MTKTDAKVLLRLIKGWVTEKKLDGVTTCLVTAAKSTCYMVRIENVRSIYYVRAVSTAYRDLESIYKNIVFNTPCDEHMWKVEK